jgi:hypothetical protein
MNSSLKDTICSLQGRPANDDIALGTIATHAYEGLAYACVYWASHLTVVNEEDIQDADDVRDSERVSTRTFVALDGVPQSFETSGCCDRITLIDRRESIGSWIILYDVSVPD